MEILIFKDVDDFLKQMEVLQNHFTTIEHYCKFIKNIQDVRNQLKYLKNTHLLCGYGFESEKTYKLTIRDRKTKYCIIYKFKHRYDFKEFRREIQKYL